MEIETLTILKLNSKEASALKRLLGTHSHDSKIKLGLTSDESDMITGLYDALPSDDGVE